MLRQRRHCRGYTLTVSSVIANLELDQAELAEFCRSHGIRRVAFFGSVLREDFGPQSDVDVLVEFNPGAAVSLFEFCRMEMELSALLGGRRVDLLTYKSLNRWIRHQVLHEAVEAYAAV